MFPARKETHAETGGAERRELGTQWAKNSSSSGFKLKSKTSSFDDDQKIANMDGGTAEHENGNEQGKKSPGLSSGVDSKSQNSAEKVTGILRPVQKGSPVTDTCESMDLKREDVVP
ncbi:serine-rich adhesin for platelets-like, partial [Trifolium medium]|nr:serine-rich adhesin for platelets-like [Trifolium medium]